MLFEGMAEDDDWFGRLKQAIADDGRSSKTISLAAGLGQNYVTQMLSRNAPPKLPTLNKLLDVLGADTTKFVMGAAPLPLPSTSEVRAASVPMPVGMEKNVPVRGTVAASDFARGAFQLTPDVVDYVRRPPGLISATDVYALYVEGQSMLPKFEAGELIYVNPNRPVRPGDYVVIQEPVDADTLRGFVKQFVKRTANSVVVRQFNPEGEMRFPASDALKLHRVMTIAEMMGV